MVEEVTAFKADDGSVHPTKLGAVEADAMSALKQMDIFNHGSALACIKEACALVHILTPVAEAQFEAAEHTPREQIASPPASETVHVIPHTVSQG